MGFSASNNRASIEASYGQEQPNPFSLRTFYGFLKTNPSSKAYLSKPNSSHDKHKTDLITLLPKGKEIAFQVKAADAKKARTAGLNLIQKVSSSSLDYLKEQFEAVLALAS